ncbi:unnamed protein product, partial [Phaeothamnion confervicola]
LANGIIEAALFMCSIGLPRESLVSVHVFLNDIPKMHHVQGLSTINVNSGSTPDAQTIVVFRKEEVIKVIMHEFCHLLALEPRSNDTLMADSLGTVMRVEGVFRPTEAITELIARVLYSCYVARTRSFSLDVVLQAQFQHAMQNAAKILSFYGIRRTSDLDSSTIVQSTCALEYHVLTAALMY